MKGFFGHRLVTTYIFSLFDLACTFYVTARFGLDVESNPFGRLLLGDKWLAVGYKVIVVGLGLYCLYKFRECKLAQCAMWIALGGYALLAIYHIVLIGRVHWILFVR